MAMRGPRSGDVRPRVVPRPVYEDFKPMFEWKQDESVDLLIVYLPGFMKEYLKVTIEGKNTVRVRGERLLAGNKWSRFQEDYQIPEQCNATGIRAKFERGILTVTMPRKTNTIIVPPPKIEPKTTQEALSPKTKPIPQRTTDAATQAEKGQMSDTIPQKGNNYQQLEPTKPQNVKSEEKVVNKDNESKGKTKEETVEEATHESVSEMIKEKTNEMKGKGSEFERRFAEHLEEGKKKMQKAMKESIEGISSRKTDKDEILEETSKNSTSDDKESKLEYYYKKMVMGKKEERQLLVNMGAALLVIVALGAYVSYTYGSSAKANH